MRGRRFTVAFTTVAQGVPVRGLATVVAEADGKFTGIY
jgi:hypothetical protein